METGLLIIETALFAIGFFCTLVSSIVLLSSKDGRSPANRFLVYFLFTMSMVLFMIFMIVGNFIEHVPWLYRLPSPLYYFLFPSAYLYVRMVLLDEPHARKTDWFHAVPALIHLVEMMPYYLSSTESKLANILQESTNPLGAMVHSEGWLPDYMHNLIRGSQGVIYAFLMLALLWKSQKKRPVGRLVFPRMLQWLWVLSGLTMVFSLALVMAFSTPGLSVVVRSGSLYIIMAVTQIVSGLYLLLNPSILFGMPRLEKMVTKLRLKRDEVLFKKLKPNLDVPVIQDNTVGDIADDLLFDEGTKDVKLKFPEKINEPQPAEITSVNPEVKKITHGQYNNYIQLLTRLMEEEKPFLRKRYSINDLANDVKIPQHHISYLLNNIFQIRFNDYINQFRLQYIKERFENEDIGHLTLEGLALEAGFASRITFIRVVQKLTGMNPSEYFKSELV